MDRSVEYKCERGFVLVGTQSSSCINGQWSPAPPQCIRDSPCDRNPGLYDSLDIFNHLSLDLCGELNCTPTKTPAGFECTEKEVDGKIKSLNILLIILYSK